MQYKLTTALRSVGSRLHQARPLTSAKVAHRRSVAIVAWSSDTRSRIFGVAVLLRLRLLRLCLLLGG